MKVKELIQEHTVVPPNTKVSKASGILRNKGLRDLIVVEDDELVGMVNTLWITEMATQPNTKVKNIMFKPPTTSPSEDVRLVIRMMVDNALETIPVVDEDKLIGVVTSDVILKNSEFDGKVRAAMVDAITIEAQEKITEARRLMRMHDINRLPVVDDGELVGIISASDIVGKIGLKKGYPKKSDLMGDTIKFLNGPVEAIMTSEVYTIEADAPLSKAAEKMLSKDVRGLPVVANKRLLGIICRKDLLRTLYPYVSGVLVSFSGLKDVSDWTVMQLKRTTGDWVKRLVNYADLSDVQVDVKRMHGGEHGGDLYRMNIHTNHVRNEFLKEQAPHEHKRPDKHFVSHAEGYGIVRTANEAFGKLERRLSRSKGKE